MCSFIKRSTISHVSCVHELRTTENIKCYLFSWNISKTTIVGTLNRKLLTDVMMLLKKIEKKFLKISKFSPSC